MFKKVSSLVLAAALLLVGIPSAETKANAAQDIAITSTESQGSYTDYIKEYSTLESAKETIVIDATADYTTDQDITIEEIEGKKFAVTKDDGYIEWSFNVNTAAVYHVAAVWANIPGKGIDVMRTVTIDGKIPFDGMNSIYFRRTWKNTGEIYYDSTKNEYSKKLEEELTVQTSDFYSLTDYFPGGYCIALSAGTHKIRFTSIQEPMAINSIIFSPYNEQKTYAQVEKEYKDNGYKSVASDVTPIIIEAEKSTYSSKSTLRPQADRSSPAVSPYDILKKKLTE